MEEKIRVMVAEDLPLLREDFCDVYPPRTIWRFVVLPPPGRKLWLWRLKPPAT